MLDADSDAPPVVCEGFASPPSVIDRYYNTRYFRQSRSQTTAYQQPDASLSASERLHEDLYIHFHNNGIAVIGVAASHPIIACKLQLSNVEWLAAAAPLLTTVLVGKRKHGSAVVEPLSAICALHTVDGQRFVIRAAVRGRLLEVNEKLSTAAQAATSGLLESDSEWGGYVGIVLMDKPQLYDLIDNKDSRYVSAQAWKEMLSDAHTGSKDAR